MDDCFRRFADLSRPNTKTVSNPDVWRTIHDDLPILDASLAKLEPLVGGPWTPHDGG